MIISSFFTLGSGSPALGLNPTIRIWEVNGVTATLVVNNDPMIEVGDGFYQYNFISYDATKDYVFRSDSVTLPLARRYQFGATQAAVITPDQVADIVSSVWDETASAHLLPGSTGEKLSQIKADTTNISVTITTLSALLDEIAKYDRNRTKIDPVAKTLTVYDDDCVTPLRVFNLLDQFGAPSVTDVCERRPTTCP